MPFALKHTRNFMKRIFYTYFLRDFNAATLELLLGVLLLAFGLTFGSVKWYASFCLRHSCRHWRDYLGSVAVSDWQLPSHQFLEF